MAKCLVDLKQVDQKTFSLKTLPDSSIIQTDFLHNQIVQKVFISLGSMSKQQSIC